VHPLPSSQEQTVQKFASDGDFSQPSVLALPLQSQNPEAQTPLHSPPAQPRNLMLLPEHDAPHAPQLSGSLSTFTSQPSECLLPLQSTNPGLQVPVHTPATHATPARVLCEHSCPHRPQFKMSFEIFVSHPSALKPLSTTVPLQFSQPGLQVPPHWPPRHSRVAMWLVEHGRPHPPQLSAASASQPFVCRFPSQST
jgi:hypothetical protein